MKRALLEIVFRALQLRCPRCGAGGMFRTRFSMHPRCPNCHLLFEREPGYFIGAMYVNYGFTVLIALSAHFILKGLVDWPLSGHVALAVTIAVALPLATFRHARSLWLAMDFFFDPPKERPRSVG